MKRSDDSIGAREAEKRATDALRRALATPYRPQSEMKLGTKAAKRKRAKNAGRKQSPTSA